jgi:DNA-binding XRE family transcriptional regulator
MRKQTQIKKIRHEHSNKHELEVKICSTKKYNALYIFNRINTTLSEQSLNLIEKQKNTTLSEQSLNLIEKQKNTTLSEQTINLIEKQKIPHCRNSP